MLFSSPQIDPLQLLVGKDFGRRARDCVKQRCLQKGLPRGFGCLRKNWAVVECQ